MTALADQLVAIHEALDRGGISHAFGGAIALAYCIDQARATSDIDVNVFVAPSEAARVFAALPAGVAARAPDRRVAERDGQVRLWWDTTPVDLFFSYHPFHERAARRSRQVPFDGHSIPVLDCTDLAVFKAFFARTRDWADIEAMAASGSVDETDALGWVAELLGEDDDDYRRLEAALRAPAPASDKLALRRALGRPKRRRP